MEYIYEVSNSVVRRCALGIYEGYYLSILFAVVGAYLVVKGLGVIRVLKKKKGKSIYHIVTGGLLLFLSLVRFLVSIGVE